MTRHSIAKAFSMFLLQNRPWGKTSSSGTLDWPVPCGARSLSVVTNRPGQGGQGSRCKGPGEVPFLLKKSLGKTRGPASNQTKIQFFKKIIFIIEHIKKTRIFLKKKIEKNK